ncbi:hypothetical protein AVEN_260166-1 [Araneus ventricosus]|uniref:Uncharacterized protein n=1 Tax=Araneus ventricosus TaxID=182803 RepID=A0A4Y2DPS2_ARAVE|nr:hypothetical protein AVEN_260166-1 [Araneus ventricosus]
MMTLPPLTLATTLSITQFSYPNSESKYQGHTAACTYPSTDTKYDRQPIAAIVEPIFRKPSESYAFSLCVIGQTRGGCLEMYPTIPLGRRMQGARTSFPPLWQQLLEEEN